MKHRSEPWTRRVSIRRPRYLVRPLVLWSRVAGRSRPLVECAPPVERMSYGEIGMPKDHARTRVAHDLPYLVAHVASKAVDGASGAGGFGVTEATSFDTLLRIGKEQPTPLAQDVLPAGGEAAIPAAVVGCAVHLDHHLERSPLSRHSSRRAALHVVRWHQRLPETWVCAGHGTIGLAAREESMPSMIPGDANTQVSTTTWSSSTDDRSQHGAQAVAIPMKWRLMWSNPSLHRRLP